MPVIVLRKAEGCDSIKALMARCDEVGCRLAAVKRWRSPLTVPILAQDVYPWKLPVQYNFLEALAVGQACNSTPIDSRL
jgi:hypothetical protein